MGNIDVEAQLADGGSFYLRDEYSKYGVINWYQRFKGNISIQQDLREFPFDRQTVRIKLGATLWASDVILLKDWTPHEQLELFSVGMNFTEWTLVSIPQIIDSVELSVEDKRPISYLEISFRLRRKSMYYVTHVIFLVFLIDVMAWTVFTIGPDVSSRLSLDITLFLALVALNFVVIGFIPKVSYGTKLSQYFVISYACITIATLQNVVAYVINDYYCINGYDPRYPIPVVNDTNPLVSTTPRCWTALYFDWFVLGSMIVGQTGYTFHYVISGSRALPNEHEISHELDPYTHHLKTE